MDPWLFLNEIRHYLGQTFNARSSGIVELRNHSIGGRSPKLIFTLWQLWINICIFFQKFFWLFEQCPVQPLWVLGMRCLHLPVRALCNVLLLPCGFDSCYRQPHTQKACCHWIFGARQVFRGSPKDNTSARPVHCWGWSDRIVSWVTGRELRSGVNCIVVTIVTGSLWLVRRYRWGQVNLNTISTIPSH